MKKKMIPLVDLKAQYLTIKKDIDAAIKRVIKLSAFINGSDNSLFEKEFAQFVQAKYAVSVSSGSQALDLALEALGITEGDEVICPAHTFTATAEAIVHRQAVPVFVDIDELSYNLDPEQLESKITPRTKAIIIVHLYGQPADMDKIKTIAKKHHLKVIEDAAQAHGALYKGKRVGALGDIGCFSFFPSKNLGCFGDGGMVVTSSKRLADKVMMLKDHGRSKKYDHLMIGYGARMDNLQAAVLRVKLKKLDLWNQRRREIAQYYNFKLKGQYIVPEPVPETTPVYYVYTLRSKKRDMLIEKLKSNLIAAGIYYPIPLHLQKAYRFLNYKTGDLPKTEKVAREIFSIPIYPEMTKKQMDKVVNVLLSTSTKN